MSTRNMNAKQDEDRHCGGQSSTAANSTQLLDPSKGSFPTPPSTSVTESADGAGIGKLASRRFKASEDYDIDAHLQGLFQLRIGQAVPPAQQHELEHGQWGVRFGSTAMGFFPSV